MGAEHLTKWYNIHMERDPIQNDSHFPGPELPIDNYTDGSQMASEIFDGQVPGSVMFRRGSRVGESIDRDTGDNDKKVAEARRREQEDKRRVSEEQNRINHQRAQEAIRNLRKK